MGADVAPSISPAALRFRHAKRAARRVSRFETPAKPHGKFLRRPDFSPPARCAFVTPNAQRATYVRPDQ